MFKDSFKYYKARKPPPDFTNVIKIPPKDNSIVKKITIQATDDHLNESLGLKSPQDWQVYQFINIPGLIFIKNPFTSKGQRFWIIKCLKEYSKEPNKLNFDVSQYTKNKSWWDFCFENPVNNEIVINKLRWITLGYHHNWDTKLYSEDSKTPMPVELSMLTQYLATVLEFTDYKAEAAIINYYRMNSTLAGHTDHSEINTKAPLFSVSFGQTAIFLIGGLSIDDPANALFLESGDILIMSGESRLRYHGVPKILATDNNSWESDEVDNMEDWNKAKLYISTARININVRQVLKKGQLSLYCTALD